MIQKARIQAEDEAFHVSAAPRDTTAAELARMDLEEQEGDDDLEAEEAMRSAEQTVKAVAPSSAVELPADKELHSFEIDPGQVRLLPGCPIIAFADKLSPLPRSLWHSLESVLGTIPKHELCLRWGRHNAWLFPFLSSLFESGCI